MSTPATYFNEREHLVCLVAHLLGRRRLVADGGSPRATIKEGYGA